MPEPLHYRYTDADSDYLLVLIHGLFGSLDNLSVVQRHFKDKVNILAIDLPDHGQSPHVDNFSLSVCMSGLVELLDQFEHKKIGLLGHSLGGKVAMLTALTYPDRIDDLIVADIAPVSYPPRHTDIIAALKSVSLDKIQSRQDADKQLQAGIKEVGVRQFLLKSLAENSTGQWHWRFNLDNLAKHYDQIKGWPQTTGVFDKPCLFIKGSQSDYITGAMQPAIQQLFPKAKAHIIDNTGHWLHAEKPTSFNRVVEKHILNP
ncbi:alpha/beta fold hydrolase [Alteromonas sp. C1M14]|uniref:alpha/beta fold hydrolase n=1 Tax=Alteromonas sp. C1M14 TaxID=2841567 RepID=UPI001C085656|nr:alpha/beta fold hydrolase [Alteromonas sp. C1M14]MBU2976751.1 alpha/beta fold hydrolase [Alteromonas sp. C1M14]